MKTVRIEEFRSHVGEEVLVRGWIHNKRSSGKLQFLIVRDGSGFAQAVVSKKAVPRRGLGRAREGGAGVLDRGRRARCARTSARPAATRWTSSSATVLQAVHDYPITPKEHGTAFLMENRHLWLRSARQHAIARVRHTVVKAVRDYLDDQGYMLVDTPIFTPAACEGTTTLFGVPYFDEGTAYLTQSGQLYNEATAAAHGKVYCFGPTFRAEKSKTRRHLTEFWMVEPEIAFAHLDDAVALAEGLVCYVVAQALEKRKEDLEGPRARHREAREREGALPAAALQRRDDAPAGEGLGDPDGERLRRHRRDGDRRGVRPPGRRPPLPVGDQGLLHGARPGGAGVQPLGRHPRARGLRRDRGRGRAPRRPRAPPEAHPRARPARGGVPLVPRPAQVRHASRTRASAWASSAWSRGSAASTTCARRSPSRGCCTGSTRRHVRSVIQHGGDGPLAAGHPPTGLAASHAQAEPAFPFCGASPPRPPGLLPASDRRPADRCRCSPSTSPGTASGTRRGRPRSCGRSASARRTCAIAVSTLGAGVPLRGGRAAAARRAPRGVRRRPRAERTPSSSTRRARSAAWRRVHGGVGRARRGGGRVARARPGRGSCVGDIPPLAFAAARRAGLPSVAVGNFSWDWIYGHLAARVAGPRRGGRHGAREPYAARGAAAAAAVRGRPVGLPARRGRAARRRRPAVARRPRPGGASASTSGPCVLLSFGGVGLPGLQPAASATLGGYQFLLTGPGGGRPRLPSNLRCIDGDGCPRRRASATRTSSAPPTWW